MSTKTKANEAATPGTIQELGPELAMLLDAIQGNTVTPIITGEEVEFHDGKKIVLPKGMTFERAYRTLQRLQKEAETITSFTRVFRFRPDDGAVAALTVLRRKYGMVLGKEIQTFFGTRPPETRDVAVGVGVTVQVPWGMIEIPTLENTQICLGETVDREYGPVFGVNVNAPRKYKDEIQDLFDQLDAELRTNSIYQGKALLGAKDLEFYDHSKFDPNQIVYSSEAERMLEGTLWTVIRHTDTLRQVGIPRKRAILLEGPFGTGKTSVGMTTAKVCEAHGWTFISARPGRDRIEDVLRTARLYQPALVFVEDIDGEGGTGDTQEVTRLLDAFDGVTSKGGEVMMVLTTNHLDRIHKGMLRPGRLDAVIHIGNLDAAGVERLVRVVVGVNLAEDVDFARVTAAMDGFYPAFVREACDRARTFAIAQSGGSPVFRLTTDALVAAADSLRPQLEAMHDATEGKPRPTLDVALAEVVKGAVVGHVGIIPVAGGIGHVVGAYDPEKDAIVKPEQA